VDHWVELLAGVAGTLGITIGVGLLVGLSRDAKSQMFKRLRWIGASGAT